MDYVEEREFVFRLEARVAFPADYQGEADGYAWVPEFQALAARMLRGLLDEVRAAPGWSAQAANRGRSADDEITLVLERKP